MRRVQLYASLARVLEWQLPDGHGVSVVVDRRKAHELMLRLRKRDSKRTIWRRVDGKLCDEAALCIAVR